MSALELGSSFVKYTESFSIIRWAEINEQRIWKVKFADDILLYTENTKESYKNILELIT